MIRLQKEQFKMLRLTQSITMEKFVSLQLSRRYRISMLHMEDTKLVTSIVLHAR